ncbi:hypothetical protein DyAD56_15955 [Dyella sp. AD56]|uniref:Ref family recombination enhancement nuclease n=1 Tax=Dyella sp. AD56 TaxID=1528744 RepID=UPI000C81610B|nr:Ref family recombination enhancement nuclease [Dyella sp. AD56]PMQ04182.1 hypothetical protein DyAD56_15955 [Dyella sp. AD56]
MKRTALLSRTALKQVSDKRAPKAKKRGSTLRQGRSTGTPTVGEDLRFEVIRMIGCLACLMSGRLTTPEVHHLTKTGRHGHTRRGHRYSIGLCCWHHRGEPLEGMTVTQCTAVLGPSYARHARKFRTRYGSDDSLLALQDQLIALKVIDMQTTLNAGHAELWGLADQDDRINLAEVTASEDEAGRLLKAQKVRQPHRGPLRVVPIAVTVELREASA